MLVTSQLHVIAAKAGVRTSFKTTKVNCRQIGIFCDGAAGRQVAPAIDTANVLALEEPSSVAGTIPRRRLVCLSKRVTSVLGHTSDKAKGRSFLDLDVSPNAVGQT
jgi:hypothetical protein